MKQQLEQALDLEETGEFAWQSCRVAVGSVNFSHMYLITLRLVLVLEEFFMYFNSLVILPSTVIDSRGKRRGGGEWEVREGGGGGGSRKIAVGKSKCT